MDQQDALAGFRSEFHLPLHKEGVGAVYLCGHSLGLAPKATTRIVNEELAVWAQHGVEGHFAAKRPWLSYHEQFAPGLAQLAGAMTSEVVAMNSLSVNLHLMLTTFYRPTRERHKLVIEKRAFSSDRYAVASQIAQRGFDPAISLVEIDGDAGDEFIRTETICALIEREGSSIATLLLPGVQYLSGQYFDMRIYLPGYLMKWLCNCVLALALALLDSPGSHSAGRPGLLTLLAAGAGVIFACALTVLFVTGYIYVYLSSHDD